MCKHMRLSAYLLLSWATLVVFAQNDPGSGTSETDCEVTSWSDWGSCVRSPACSRVKSGISAKAHRMGVTRGFDMGRMRMREMTASKESQWKQRESCTASHDCPEMDPHPPIIGRKACKNGLADIYPCRNIDLMAFINFKELTGGMKLKAWGSPRGSDLWGWTDPLYDQEYVLMGTTHGTAFVRITDPENPLVVGFLETRTLRSIWRDIKVVKNFAYIGSEAWDHGMQIFDLTRLRKLDSFKVLKADVDYLELGNTHNVVGNDETDMIYLVGDRQRGYEKGCKGGLHMINVSIPLKPKFVGCFDSDGYSHDAQCVIYRGPDWRYHGDEICFNYNEDSLTIVNVSNKEQPLILSKIGYDGSQYTHQGWLTENHHYILMDDEWDEKKSYDDDNKHTRTLVWDVRKLMVPKLVKEFWSHEKAIDHNQYTRGNFSYQSNYEAGLRIINFDQSTMDMKEVAYFDVFPMRTTAAFGGTWSNYPYFKSGIVPISSIEFGLYIVKPNMDAISRAVASDVPYGEETRMRTITKAKDGGICPHPVETHPCTPDDC